jgi:uncharacterized protein YjiK
MHMPHTSHSYLSRHFFPYLARIGSLIVIVMHLSFCNPPPDVDVPHTGEGFSYDLETPDARYKLPGYLEEISGLSFISKGKVACVQDEKALIYVLNLEKEKLIEKVDFGKDADYEDIAVVDKTAYVLRSDGDIFRIKDFRKKNRKVRKFETPLKEKNNTEGLAYDPLSTSLLIACKGSPSIDKDKPFKGFKAVYRFDLKEEELVEDPYFLIDLDELTGYRDLSSLKRFSLRVAKGLRMIESETIFKPSGIALHPIDDDFYIIASKGKLLIILDREGKVRDVKELDPKLFRQPEGICFSPDGDMYISNEGQGGKGYILKFNIHATRE